jgi:aspartate-semialdehyde dehydrogenase
VSPAGAAGDGLRVGLVGATGLVGTEMRLILEERRFPVGELRAYASPRSEGRRLAFGDREVVCQVLTEDGFDGLDLVVVDVDDPISAEWSPVAAAAGAKVIDKSAAFRMDPEVPLVVSEVNPEDLAVLPKGIASCPNCTTMVLLVAVAPLHRAAGIRRMVVATYQATSGAGTAGIEELDEQLLKYAPGDAEVLRRAGTNPEVLRPGRQWGRPIAGNVIPLAGSVKDDSGYTSEEQKLVRESRKILHAPDLPVTGTCVRVPVFVGHSMAVNLEFDRPVGRAEALALLEAAPGLRVVDGGAGWPTALEGAGIDPVLVGRVREDPSRPGAIDLWVTGDNLRKGAALNAVQMAEVMYGVAPPG